MFPIDPNSPAGPTRSDALRSPGAIRRAANDGVGAHDRMAAQLAVGIAQLDTFTPEDFRTGRAFAKAFDIEAAIDALEALGQDVGDL